ncbi:uncharacterized protein LOC120004204 [Tripterygium wilfordii]|uniref:uncharacterized protein LOC120004204 n=1 Tax=Tripterygium wilfordii TaxID=458696 RepID=UPI0018F85273|nr:uncharacterized protein LOC120004204 [Tripterygium wilfordii]
MELSGFIFMCNGKTKPQCYQYRVFGLPAVRKQVVEKIKCGMKLFLFDFDVKLLYGIYEATSDGKLNLEYTAFGGRFPAQVRFRIFKDCLPLPESNFKLAIQENYQNGKFSQELNAQQVRDLLSMFDPFAVSMPLPFHPMLPNMATPSLFTPPNRSRERRFQPQARLPVEVAGVQVRHGFTGLEAQHIPQTIIPQQHDYYAPIVNLGYTHPSNEAQDVRALRDQDMAGPGIHHEYNPSVSVPQHVEQMVTPSHYSSYGSMVNRSQTESATHAQAPSNPYYPMEHQNSHLLGELVHHLPDLYRRYGADTNVAPYSQHLGLGNVSYQFSSQGGSVGYWDHQQAPAVPHTSQPVQTHSSIPEIHTMTAPYSQNLGFGNATYQFPSQGGYIVPQQENAVGYGNHQQTPAAPHTSQPVQTHSSTPETAGLVGGNIPVPLMYPYQGYPSVRYGLWRVVSLEQLSESRLEILTGECCIQLHCMIHLKVCLHSHFSRFLTCGKWEKETVHKKSRLKLRRVPIVVDCLTCVLVYSVVGHTQVAILIANVCLLGAPCPCPNFSLTIRIITKKRWEYNEEVKKPIRYSLNRTCQGPPTYRAFDRIKTEERKVKVVFVNGARMGICCSDAAGGMSTVAGTAAAASPNDAISYFLKSRGYHGLFSEIELSFSATNLRDLDVFSKSDPMVVVYTKGKDGALREVCRTEVVLNSLNPTWVTKYIIMFQFEVVQTLLFRLYDIDTQFHNVDVKILNLEEQEFLGEASCSLSEVVTKSNGSLTLDIVRREESSISSHSRCSGKLTVHAEECINSKTTTEIIFRCSELESKDMFSKSDPFLVISKIVEGGIPIPVCKTEVIKNDLKPTWKPVFLNIQQVGSKDSPLVIECFNFNSNARHDLLGKVQKSLRELEKLHSSGEGENLFIPPSTAHNDHNKVSKSLLFVDKFAESIQNTFLDYLAGGFELNFMVAVDFTASNGNPRLPDSLHYIDPSGRPNAYQQAIIEVGEVLQFYDSDRHFPAWGFGARPIDGPVSHCFNLNGSSSYCEVEGIQGIMTAYTSALFNVSLAGPTLFGHVITNAALIASQSHANGGRKYFVLLIITDGVVTDLQETKDALVKASDLPLSVLIVGVGGADFKEMENLDADKGDRLESSSGRVASRDIVQFVPLRDVQSGEISVVQALLAELPSQFLTYMRTRNIEPTT